MNPEPSSRAGTVGRLFRNPVRETTGLTLLEVMLALMILSLAGAIFYGALNTVLTTWSAGLTQGRRGQVAGIALDRMTQQLKSGVPAMTGEETRRRIAFEGKEEILRFVTLLPVGPYPLAQVSYSMEETGEGSSLVYREYLWPDKKFFEEGEPVREETLSEIESMEILLRGQEEDEPVEEDEFPSLVEIELRVKGEGDETDRTFTATAPFLVGPWRKP